MNSDQPDVHDDDEKKLNINWLQNKNEKFKLSLQQWNIVPKECDDLEKANLLCLPKAVEKIFIEFFSSLQFNSNDFQHIHAEFQFFSRISTKFVEFSNSIQKNNVEEYLPSNLFSFILNLFKFTFQLSSHQSCESMLIQKCFVEFFIDTPVWRELMEDVSYQFPKEFSTNLHKMWISDHIIVFRGQTEEQHLLSLLKIMCLVSKRLINEYGGACILENISHLKTFGFLIHQTSIRCYLMQVKWDSRESEFRFSTSYVARHQLLDRSSLGNFVVWLCRISYYLRSTSRIIKSSPCSISWNSKLCSLASFPSTPNRKDESFTVNYKD
jgi:hypothetical protein